MKRNNAYRCSFCGRGKEEVMILVAGIEGHICENCVEQAQEIILEELNSGIYLVKLNSIKGSTSTKKLVIR